MRIAAVALVGFATAAVAQQPDTTRSQLPAVTVVAKPNEFAHTTKYDDYFRRSKVGVGVFRSRDDIDRFGATDVTSMLQRIPGVSVSLTSNPHGEQEVRFRMARCPGQPPNIAIYVNGSRIPLHDRTAENKGSELSGLSRQRDPNKSTCDACSRIAEILQSVALQDLLFLEFYRGPGEMPADLDRGGSCAALVLWTR